MGTNSKIMHEIGRHEVINPDVDVKRNIDERKGEGVIARIRHRIARVVTIEENGLQKSKDWPYLWKKK